MRQQAQTNRDGMKVLVINTGSSSIKFALVEMSSGDALAAGLLERIGETAGRMCAERRHDDRTVEEVSLDIAVADHRHGVKHIAAWLTESGALQESEDLAAIGHRVAHGGAEFTMPALIDEQVLAAIRRQIPLAPLHNPASLLGIEVTRAEWPKTPQVAVFDTAFHHTIPPHAAHYPLPWELTQANQIRRFGFHGTSHKYASDYAARLLNRSIEEVNLITLHLGNGASATAIRGGKSIDTSMGMTPLEGLMMGTRSGDVDPGVILHLIQSLGIAADEAAKMLNKESGLQGICGDHDMRDVLQRAASGDQQAGLAVEMYAYRIKKYIGAYCAVLPRLDALVFTAGIGEHAAEIRARACGELEHLGIVLDAARNASRDDGAFAIHADRSAVKVFVVPANEELEIAGQTWRCACG